MTITEFLLARIAEDEEVAKSAGGGRWSIAPGADGIGWHDGLAIAVVESTWDACISVAPAEHTVRHDPARVLAECQAKRAIVGRHKLGSWHSGVLDVDVVTCETCNTADDDWPCPDLRDLAAVYADHPDYDDAWRP